MKEKFPERYSLLVIGQPGVGKLEYCIHLAKFYLEKGDKVIFISTNNSFEELSAIAEKEYLQLKNFSKNFIFIDCYTLKSEGEFSLKSISDLEGLNILISKTVEKLSPPVKIIFHSLSTLFLYNEPKNIARFFQSLTNKVKTDYGFIAYTLQDGMHDAQTVITLSSIIDGVVEIQFDEKLNRKIRYKFLKGIETDGKWRNFVIDRKIEHPLKTKVERLLIGLTKENGVKGVGVAEKDGLNIYTTLLEKYDTKRISAISSTLVGASEMLCDELKKPFGNTIINAEDENIVLKSCGKYLLMVIVEKENNEELIKKIEETKIEVEKIVEE